jgi:transposase
MTHIAGRDRNQDHLLPPSIDEYVGPDNPVRFIDAFVAQLDLQDLGFVRAEAKATGRPGYHPGDLLKLYIYGYVNRVRSSRRLEAENGRNLEVIWLLRGLQPDFKTIADFRKENHAAFKQVFREFTLLCRKLDLYGGELVAIDGTKLKAVNSRDNNFTHDKLAKLIRSADERLADYLARLDRADAEENAVGDGKAKNLADKIAALKGRREHHVELLQTLERTGAFQISLTDPDSRAMAGSPKVGVGYNAQVAVDAKHKMIVVQDVTNAGSDLGLLTPTACAAKEVLGVKKIDVVADKGYYKGEDIKACDDAGISAYVACPQRGSAVKNGFFRKDEFHYDAERDEYLCPGGHFLQPTYRNTGNGTVHIHYLNRSACRGCPLKSRCTTNDARRINRWEGEAVLDEMAARLAARPEILRVRRETVEHPFGSIKQWMNQGYFLMRGIEKVRGEFSLTAVAYNIRRVLNLVTWDALMAAVKVEVAPG